MESPTNLIPENLISAGMKPQALDFLRAQAWPGEFKVQVLEGWALVAGALLSASDRASILASGWK